MPPTRQQQLRRARIEGLIGLAAPALDLLLAAGDRVSQIVSPGDDYIPIRAPADAFELRPARAADTAPSREIAD
jgi:hypothetical protein